MSSGLPYGECPLDGTDDEEGLSGVSGISWAVRAIGIGTLCLLVFNTHSIKNWANQLPLSAKTAQIVSVANELHDQAGDLGLNIVVDEVEAEGKRIRTLDWPPSPTYKAGYNLILTVFTALGSKQQVGKAPHR